MAERLELRSTFRLSGEGLGALTLPSDRPVSPPDTFVNTKSNQSSETLLKKNSYLVSTSISQAIYQSLEENVRAALEPHSSKKLSSLLNDEFSKEGDFLSLRNIRESLVGYKFQKGCNYHEEVKSKFFIKKGSHAGHVIFHIPAFVPQDDLKVPEGATNFKIFSTLISISDFEKSGDEFTSLNYRQHGQSFAHQTPMLPLLKITTQPITAQLRINNPEFSPAGMSSVVVVGIKYYTYKDKKFSQMKENTRLCIMAVN